jgi:hypothetical protein
MESENMTVAECIKRYSDLMKRYPILEQISRACVLHQSIFDLEHNFLYDQKNKMFTDLEKILKDINAE